jgi:hypothetical protein
MGGATPCFRIQLTVSGVVLRQRSADFDFADAQRRATDDAFKCKESFNSISETTSSSLSPT